MMFPPHVTSPASIGGCDIRPSVVQLLFALDARTTIMRPGRRDADIARSLAPPAELTDYDACTPPRVIVDHEQSLIVRTSIHGRRCRRLEALSKGRHGPRGLRCPSCKSMIQPYPVTSSASGPKPCAECVERQLGPGERPFQLFEWALTARRPARGCGLGLSICRLQPRKGQVVAITTPWRRLGHGPHGL
ncbi:hypothetical protein BC628DRAFT_503360 [Trametes gibbosa]|nr:hypothetical protein BC628DRAFT_503360 [Trametes gibbosa]